MEGRGLWGWRGGVSVCEVTILTLNTAASVCFLSRGLVVSGQKVSGRPAAAGPRWSSSGVHSYTTVSFSGTRNLRIVDLWEVLLF